MTSGRLTGGKISSPSPTLSAGVWAVVWFRGSTSRHCRLWLKTNLYPRRLWLQTNLYYRADSGSKRISPRRLCFKQISTMQTLAPNESLSTQTSGFNKSLPCWLWLQTNLYRADSGSKRISSTQTRASNKSLPCRLWLQTISTMQTLAPNKSLPCRLWLQTNLYRADSGFQTNLFHADSGFKQISTMQTLAPNKSLPRRHRLQTNLYRADSGSKQISPAQILAPNKSLPRRLWLKQISTRADSGFKRNLYQCMHLCLFYILIEL